MKVRRALVVLGSGVLALGLISPMAAQAAPVDAKPRGHAMVRIDGGAALAVPRGPGLYRVIMPKESTNRWLGEVGGTMTVGVVGRKGLVGSWSRLGHRAGGAHALATFTHGSDRDDPTFVGAYVGSPRVDAQGRLTFLARTPMTLPGTLRNFSLNIARPVTAIRGPIVRSGYPLVFPLNAASSLAGAQATATGDKEGQVAFVTLANGQPSGTCGTPSPVVLTSKMVNGAGFGGTCKDTTWGGGRLNLGLDENPTMGMAITMSAEVVVQTSTGTTNFPWDFTMGAWKSGGVQTWPTP